jgi:hypothetical protein
MSITGQLAVGAAGSGSLTINNGAPVSVADAVVYATCSISLDGGSLLTGPLMRMAGSGLSGYGTVTGDITDDSTITASGGTLELTGNVAGIGTLDSSRVLHLDGSVASSVTLTFDPGVLVLGAALEMNATIDNFYSADNINFAGSYGTVGGSFSDDILTVFGNSTAIAELTFAPGYNDGNVSVSENDGTVTVTTDIPYFCRGTLIRASSGDVPVEALSVGDRVLALSGEAKPIVWIGTGRVLLKPGRRCAATPIIVRRGALAEDVPHRGLRVTEGHSLYLDGVLIPAEFLVDYRSILWDDRAQVVEFYHIELATHDILLADGAPAESYRDDGNRSLFQNANNGWSEPPKPACAPVLTGGPIVDALWRRLLDRTGPRLALPLTAEPDLHLLVDGERVDALRYPDGYYTFNLVKRPAELRLVSRAASPAERGLTRDPRMLGVAVRQIRLCQGERLHLLDAAEPILASGFHGFEPTDGLR